MYFVGHGQSLLTDPYHLTYAARNAVLFDNWNMFDYFRWDVFKNSLISGVSYLVFSMIGVSRISANLVAVVLHLGGLLLFLAGLHRFRGNEETLLTALLLMLNGTLFFYGRLPFLENGLIFLSGLTFLVFVKYFDKLWGQFLVGFLIALAALAGKLFGFILIGPAVLALIYYYRTRSVKPILIMFGGAAVSALAYVLIFYEKNISVLTQYYSEQTVGMYGSPPGFSSVGNFFKMLLIYGGESGLTEFTPFVVLMILISLIIIIFTINFSNKPRRDLVPIIFCAGWLIAGVAGLMPFYYRPIRYALFLFLPGAAVSGYVLKAALDDKIVFRLSYKWVSIPLLFLCFWYLLTQVYLFFTPFGGKFKAGAEILPETAMAAFVITGLIFLLYLKRQSYTVSFWPKFVLGLILLATCINQGRYIYKGLTESGHYLQSYNREIAQIIDSDAVLTGPYGPALTIDNNLKSVIYVFGLANVEQNLFERFPITHIAVDRHNWKRAVQDFPFLDSSLSVLQTVLRDQVLYLYRVPGANVPKTDYETGQEYFLQNRFDSAYVYFEKFTEKYPDNLFGKMHLGLVLSALGNIDRSEEIFGDLLKIYPDNYVLQAVASGYYKRLYEVTKDIKYSQLSEYFRLLGLELNPRMATAN